MRPRARSDLEGIWRYTYKHWGEEQATRYLRQLNQRITKLGDDPERGKSFETIRPGYRSIHVGRHMVLYTFTAKTIGVERVLHDQMDVGRHL